MKSVKGWSRIDNSLLFNNDLSPYSKLTLTMLNYYTRNGKGECFARKKTLSQMIGISLYKLRKALNELEQLKLIHIERPGLGKPDRITIKNSTPECAETLHQPYHCTREEDLREEEEELSISNTDNVDEDTPQIATTHQKQANPNVQSTTAPPNHHQHQQHQQATETITSDFRDKIEPQIGINAYRHFFSNISVVNETDDTISLYSPHGNHIANLIKEQYSTKLEKITNKRVEVTS